MVCHCDCGGRVPGGVEAGSTCYDSQDGLLRPSNTASDSTGNDDLRRPSREESDSLQAQFRLRRSSQPMQMPTSSMVKYSVGVR